MYCAANSKTAVYCEHHGDDAMVDISCRSCSHGSCKNRSSLNVEGSTRAAYCKQHAKDGMVDATRRLCSHSSCTMRPKFKFESCNAEAYCRSHAQEGMVGVNLKGCSHISCMRPARWGVLAGGAATTCVHHKRDIVGSPVIDFLLRCTVVGCFKAARWGLHGKQPTHCRVYGPQMHDLVCTVGTVAGRSTSGSPSYGAVSSASFQVKTECSF